MANLKKKSRKSVDVMPNWRLVFMAISWHRPQVSHFNPNWINKKRAQHIFKSVFYPVIKDGADGASSNWGTACMTGLTDREFMKSKILQESH
jgi:hypothetical protein